VALVLANGVFAATVRAELKKERLEGFLEVHAHD
jgi:hypothetical protein